MAEGRTLFIIDLARRRIFLDFGRARLAASVCDFLRTATSALHRPFPFCVWDYMRRLRVRVVRVAINLTMPNPRRSIESFAISFSAPSILSLVVAHASIDTRTEIKSPFLTHTHLVG